MKYHVFKDSPPGKKRHRDYGKYLYAGFLMFTLIACNVQPVMAATIWDKAWFKFSFGSLQQRISAKRRSYQTPFRYSHRSYNQQ